MTMPFHLAGMALPISPELPDLLRSVVREQQFDLTVTVHRPRLD